MHTDQSATDALIDDILDPNLSAPAICRAHAISLEQLIEFLRGPEFQQLTEATHLLAESRTQLLALDIAPRAMQALDHTTATDEESRRINETIRKSATKLLTIARQSTTNTHHPQHTRAESVSPTNQLHIASSDELASVQATLASSPGHPGEVSARADGGGLHSNLPRSHRPNPSNASSPDHPWDVLPRSGDGGGFPDNELHPSSHRNLPLSSPGLPGEVSAVADGGGLAPFHPPPNTPNQATLTPVQAHIARAGSTQGVTNTDPPNVNP